MRVGGVLIVVVGGHIVLCPNTVLLADCSESSGNEACFANSFATAVATETGFRTNEISCRQEPLQCSNLRRSLSPLYPAKTGTERYLRMYLRTEYRRAASFLT